MSLGTKTPPLGERRIALADRAGLVWSAGRGWLSAHDPDYVALRRAARTALVMPAMFALGEKVIGNPAVATFAAFGSFAMLLLVDFSGSIKDRVLDQAALGVACAILIALATLVSRTTWLAAVAMALVAFAVLFAGVLSSVLAGATTSLLLAFILPVSLAGSPGSIPDRLAGWGMAAAASLLAISLLWPAPARNPVRAAAIAACRALVERLRADVAYMSGAHLGWEARRAAIARADEAVNTMQTRFFATPYHPGSLSTDARAVIQVVDELRWLNGIVLRSMAPHHQRRARPHVWDVKSAAAGVLEQAAGLIEDPRRSRRELDAAVVALRGALAELERAATAVVVADLAPASDAEGAADTVLSSLEPSFRAHELSFVALQIAASTSFAAAAGCRSWIERLLGHQPEGVQRAVTAARERAGSHLARESLWLQNSLRGATALGLAVLVADVSSVQHGFWVAFGTLSVLRSNALSTGQNILRALAGTAVGFLVGGLLVYLIGTDTTVLWVVLPIAVMLAGLAPATVSFAAGQAAFTLTLLILFNLLLPAGWRIGVVRVEDVAIGGAVSLAVGILFWPRGASGALGRSLAQAYRDGARYLASAVAYGVGQCDLTRPQSPPPASEARIANASFQRLDATFRGYLAERGSKPAPLADVTGLVTGTTGLRLAADAVLDLWNGDGDDRSDRAAARRELMNAAVNMSDWYGHFAAGLTGEEHVPDPLASDDGADRRLVDAVGHDLADHDGRATATGVRVIWTGEHLDAVRRLQATLVDPARAAVPFASDAIR